MHCLLVAGTPPTLPQPAAGTRRIWYDVWDTDGQDISLVRLLARDLLALRDEHAAWAYTMGQLQLHGATLADHLRPAGTKDKPSLSAWWCSILYERHPKVEPALYTVYMLRCLERLLTKLGATSLEVHGLDATCCDVLEDMCQGHGWAFARKQVADPPKPSLLRRLYSATPALLRTWVRFAVWLWQVKRLLPKTTLAPSTTPTGTIATYFPNIDVAAADKGELRSRYWESLHDALAEDAKARQEAGQKDGTGEPVPAVRWLFVRFPSPQGSLAQCCAWKKAFGQKQASGVSFNYLEEFLGLGDMCHALAVHARHFRTSLALEKELKPHFHFAGSRLNFWPLLGSDYVESFRGWRCLERALQQRGIENYVAQAGPQAWYTFPMENCPWERMLTHAVHRAGTGPVFGAQHSTIRPTDFRYFDDPRTWTSPETLAFQPDKVLGNGQSACAQWAQAGVPADRLGKIEALRYLYLGKSLHKATTCTGKLLVVTSFFADETYAHLDLVCACLKEGLFTTKDLVLKPHPYLPVEERLHALLGDKAREIAISTRPMPEELAKLPAVWASNSTTAALEAALMGLPVLVMQPVGDFDLCPLQDVPDLPRTSDVASVRAALASLHPVTLDDDYLCLDEALPRWRNLLQLKSHQDNSGE